MIELSLLKAFLNRQNFESYRELLNPKTLSRQSVLILKDIEVYFNTRTASLININEFSTFFFNIRNPYLDDKSVTEYKEIFKLIEEHTEENEIEQLISGFKKQVLFEELKRDLDQNQDLECFRAKLEKFEEENKREQTDYVFEDMDLSKANEYTDRSRGLLWRCKALSEYFDGGVITGDFILVAGFVGQGKSSFIASELSHMGTQLDNDDYILWLSNEGNWKSLLPRLYSAAINATPSQLRTEQERAMKIYKKEMKGNINRIRILDIQGWTAKDIEKLVKKQPPRLLAIDLVDNIEGFDRYTNKESNWEKYGKLYQWCREIATKYCPVIGVSQLNGDAEDQMYPKMSQLRGSRVEKQSACTALLTIGSIIGDNTRRYLSMPKSKVRSDLSDWKAEVKVDMLRSRYL